MNEQNEKALTPNEENPKQPEQSSAAHTLFDYVEMLVWTVSAVVLLLTFVFRICVVSGPSMNNTLLNGERLLVSDLFYTPETGDIVVFHQTSEYYDTFNEPIVKRVIATGGQYVKIDFIANKVYVSDDDTFTDDEILNESEYALFENPDGIWREALSKEYTIYQVPDGHLFVMGDNRNISADSRRPEVSFVDERRVLGKVLFRITPLSKLGKVE